MALYIPHSILHLARLLYVRPETFGPYHIFSFLRSTAGGSHFDLCVDGHAHILGVKYSYKFIITLTTYVNSGKCKVS